METFFTILIWIGLCAIIGYALIGAWHVHKWVDNKTRAYIDRISQRKSQ